jgi:manganese transport protein
MLLLRPDAASVLEGLVPRMDSLRNSSQLYLAAGILGATVMPHNLYLHSSLVQTRRWSTGPEMRKRALRFATLDTVIALALAFLVNASILVLAAGSFYGLPGAPVTDLSEAHRLLSPLLGTTAAGLLFGIALLAAGQSSTLTATLAGQIVMEGFLEIRLPQWKRRLLTRSLALVPALLTVLLLGDRATGQLLILSQVVLSLQLPFAVLPLVWFCSRRKLMGDLRAPNWLLLLAWITAAAILVINSALLLSLAAS